MERAPEEIADAWAWSLEAEQSLLGAILLDPACYERIASIVTAADFYTEDHRAIFRAIAATRASGIACDLVEISSYLELQNAEAFARAGGAAYLGTLAQNTPGSANAHRYAQIVRDRAMSRRLDAFAADLQRTIRDRGARDAAKLGLDARAHLSALVDQAEASHRLRAVTAADFINRELPPLEPLLSPWLFQKNLAMIHAKRGVGKTHFAMGVAYAVAAGCRFLQYEAPRARDVLYVDGEMQRQIMQKRLREHAGGVGGDVPETLRIITPDEQDKPMPDLATYGGQAELDALVREDTALIVIDNLSCLVRSGGAENEAEQWVPVADWALKHRRAGRAIIFVHHSGKSGAQRGHSKREDLLDVVINLRRPSEYQETNGAAFEVHFEKGRDLHGEDIAPIEVKLLQDPGGGYLWSYSSAATRLQERIVAHWEGGGVSITDVMKETGASRSHVHKTLEAAMRDGKLGRPYPQKQRSRETK